MHTLETNLMISQQSHVWVPLVDAFFLLIPTNTHFFLTHTLITYTYHFVFFHSRTLSLGVSSQSCRSRWACGVPRHHETCDGRRGRRGGMGADGLS